MKKPIPFRLVSIFLFIPLTLFLGSCATSQKPSAEFSMKPESLPTKLFWNLWAETNQYQPLAVLEKNRTYTVVLDLSALEYMNPAPIGIGLRQEVERLKTKQDEMKLRAFLLPDTTYFQNPSHEERSKIFKIDLKKIRNFTDPKIRPSQVRKHLRNRKDGSEYVFGHATFELKTTGEAGWGSLAVVLFDYDSYRPIDEVIAHFCIDNCHREARPQTSPTIRGTNLLHVAAEKTVPPNASLYFLELKKDVVVGVFCDNSKNLRQDLNCFAWDTRKEIGGLVNKIKSYARDLSEFSNEADLKKTGRRLREALFPKEDDTAYTEFKRFASRKINEARTDREKPSIFVRVVTSGNELAPFLPLGLISLKSESGEEIFLGKVFTVASPLPVQSYADKTSCISRRIAVLPPEETGDEALLEARKAMETLPVMSEDLNFEFYFSLDGFKDEYLDEPSTTNEPTALFILSHHAENKIYFESKRRDSVAADEVRHRFGAHSLAVLNACGTSEHGSSEFVYKLNELGVDTVIATGCKVDGFVAGKFFDCINKQLVDHKEGKDYSISQLFNDAIDCLWEEDNYENTAKVGANALKYVFLGNGVLFLCPIEKERR